MADVVEILARAYVKAEDGWEWETISEGYKSNVRILVGEILTALHDAGFVVAKQTTMRKIGRLIKDIEGGKILGADHTVALLIEINNELSRVEASQK